MPRRGNNVIGKPAEKFDMDKAELGDPGRDAVVGRRAQALKLRVAGHTIRSIASALKVSIYTANDYVNQALAEERITIAKAKADLIELELARCDRYLRKLGDKIEKGDVKAIECALKIADRRAKYLGLDAPITLEVAPKTVNLDGVPTDILEQLVKYLPPEISVNEARESVANAEDVIDGEVIRTEMAEDSL